MWGVELVSPVAKKKFLKKERKEKKQVRLFLLYILKRAVHVFTASTLSGRRDTTAVAATPVLPLFRVGNRSPGKISIGFKWFLQFVHWQYGSFLQFSVSVRDNKYEGKKFVVVVGKRKVSRTRKGQNVSEHHARRSCQFFSKFYFYFTFFFLGLPAIIRAKCVSGSFILFSVAAPKGLNNLFLLLGCCL